jgi:hypothetical protein
VEASPSETVDSLPGRWTALEEHIAQLLPGTPSHNRTRLLAELTHYAATVVREARETRHDRSSAPDAAANNWLYSPVFICGCHRSGTTLMQQLLDGHPDLVVLPSEGTYFTSFPYVAHSQPTPAELERFAADWIARFADPNARPHFKLGRSSGAENPGVLFCRRFFAWQAALSKCRPDLVSFSSLLALVAAYRDVRHPTARPSRWVEKTPLNEFHLGHLMKFANARVIHLVRDPLASMASLRAAYAGLPSLTPPRKRRTLPARSISRVDTASNRAIGTWWSDMRTSVQAPSAKQNGCVTSCTSRTRHLCWFPASAAFRWPPIARSTTRRQASSTRPVVRIRCSRMICWHSGHLQRRPRRRTAISSHRRIPR